MKNIVILISGRGSNLQAIIQACAAQAWPARIAAVISNQPEAAGLSFAEQHGLPTAVVSHREYPDRHSFDRALADKIDSYQPDLVVLAGFMRILTAAFVARYAGRLLNIHPSLLPAFPGVDTHQQALATGVKVHGATVHFVTADLDHGPIVAQAIVPVLPTDTVATLAARVLALEHQMYPQVIRWLLEGRLQITHGIVTLRPAPDLVEAPPATSAQLFYGLG